MKVGDTVKFNTDTDTSKWDINVPEESYTYIIHPNEDGDTGDSCIYLKGGTDDKWFMSWDFLNKYFLPLNIDWRTELK